MRAAYYQTTINYSWEKKNEPGKWCPKWGEGAASATNTTTTTGHVLPFTGAIPLRGTNIEFSTYFITFYYFLPH